MGDADRTAEQMAAHRADLVDYAARITGDRSAGEDLVQEAYLRFAGLAPRSLTEPFGYLKRIVRNLALDLARARTRERRLYLPDPSWDTVTDNRPGPETHLADRQRLRLVIRALDALPPRERRALELYRFEGRTLQQLADEMGVSVSTAHAMVHRGLAACRAALEEGA